MDKPVAEDVKFPSSFLDCELQVEQQVIVFLLNFHHVKCLIFLIYHNELLPHFRHVTTNKIYKVESKLNPVVNLSHFYWIHSWLPYLKEFQDE